MAGYRESSQIISANHRQIEDCAQEMLIVLNVDSGGQEFDTLWQHARMLAAALVLYRERNEVTPDAWKSAGYLGNLLALKGKVNRLMASLWYKVAPNGNTEKPIDNALDAINYAAFFARLYEAGDERGKPWD
jgi:hypothetical protein